MGLDTKMRNDLGVALFPSSLADATARYVSRGIRHPQQEIRRGIYYTPATLSGCEKVIVGLGEYSGRDPDVVRRMFGSGGAIERLELSPYPYSYFVIEAPFEEARRFVQQIASTLKERPDLYQNHYQHRPLGVSIVEQGTARTVDKFANHYKRKGLPFHFVEAEVYGEIIDAKLR